MSSSGPAGGVSLRDLVFPHGSSAGPPQTHTSLFTCAQAVRGQGSPPRGIYKLEMREMSKDTKIGRWGGGGRGGRKGLFLVRDVSGRNWKRHRPCPGVQSKGRGVEAQPCPEGTGSDGRGPPPAASLPPALLPVPGDFPSAGASENEPPE